MRMASHDWNCLIMHKVREHKLLGACEIVKPHSKATTHKYHLILSRSTLGQYVTAVQFYYQFYYYLQFVQRRLRFQALRNGDDERVHSPIA